MNRNAWQPAVVVPVVVGGWLVSRFVPQLVTAPTLKLTLALVILPALLYFILAQVRWIRLADELQQRILLQSYSSILAGVLVGTFTLHSVLKAGFDLPLEVIDGAALGGAVGGAIAWFTTRRRYGTASLS
jgi:hypothetical protein